jgi:hypothetical protein
MRCKFVLVIIISCSGYKYLVRAIITTCSDPCSDLFSFEMTHKIVPTIIGFCLIVVLIYSDTFLFEMTYKLVLAIIINCFGYSSILFFL